jgi:2-amino-4-hydroxy-6-hydroxymethyldihydropteridine diphosphokinase
VDWAAWEPRYKDIMADFGFSIPADRQAARELESLLHGRRPAKDRDLRSLLEDADAVVAGPALDARLPAGDALLSCDSAIGAVVAQGRQPDVLVTDLDGNVELQVKANACCAVAVIHAHGDNLGALRRWVPHFPGQVVGTCQCEPVGALRNFGGFTDGDRAVFLAAHFGARRVRLAGFDFERPRPKPGRDPEVKARKLAWARKLVGEAGVPVEFT